MLLSLCRMTMIICKGIGHSRLQELLLVPLTTLVGAWAAVLIGNFLTIPTAAAAADRFRFDALSSSPLTFEVNRGQFAEPVLFRTSADGARVSVIRTGLVYQFARVPRSDLCDSMVLWRSTRGLHGWTAASVPSASQQMGSIEVLTVRAELVGADTDAVVYGWDLAETQSNYFIGNNPGMWHRRVPHYRLVVCENVYPGVDLRWLGSGGRLESEFVIKPGVNEDVIEIRYDNVLGLTLTEWGDLVVETGWGRLVEHCPEAYQEGTDERGAIPCRFVLRSDRSFGFAVAGQRNPGAHLVIDPVLTYSTYLGGNDYELGTSVAVDASGSAVIAGNTWSTDYPLVDGFQGDQPSYDAVVTRFTPEGNGLLSSTYLGGSDVDGASAVSVGRDGSVYVVGSTHSDDFATVNAFQTRQDDYEGFVARISPAGDSLVYSSYLGGHGADPPADVAVDATGGIVVVGGTSSPDFPTLNAYQTDQPLSDAFVTRVAPDGALVFSTYLGGSGDDVANAVTFDAIGRIFVAGWTDSPDFPLVTPLQDSVRGTDAFLTVIDTSSGQPVYSTFFGGGSGDVAEGVAVDRSGYVFMAGNTSSSDFPIVGGFQDTLAGIGDAFLLKLRIGDSQPTYSTYLGGGALEICRDLALDPFGAAYVAGGTFSNDFPTVEPIQNNSLTPDAFLSRISAAGDSILFSTHLGGAFGAAGWAIATDAVGALYMTGGTSSSNFPMVNPYQPYPSQGGDIFVLKLSPVCSDADADGYGDPGHPENECPTDNCPSFYNPDQIGCPCHGDPICDSVINVLDVVEAVGVAFRGTPPTLDAGCSHDPGGRTDVDCTGATDVLDVVAMVGAAFRGQTANFCNPCACNPYPTGCP